MPMFKLHKAKSHTDVKTLKQIEEAYESYTGYDPEDPPPESYHPSWEQEVRRRLLHVYNSLVIICLLL